MSALPCAPESLGGSACSSRGDVAIGEHIARGWAGLFQLNTHQVFSMFLSKYSEQLSGVPLREARCPAPGGPVPLPKRAF